MKDTKPVLKGEGGRYVEEIVSLRRYLHQHPELSREEHHTSRTIQEKLDEHGILYDAGFAGTGVLGVIEGGKSGKTVALRADMDALPIREENEYDFVSKNEGVMHACGHDAHMAMLIGTGRLLNDVKDDLPGRVLLVFQPAEEDAPTGGARPMMDDGVFREYRPDAIFAQHVWPHLPVGQVGVRLGVMTSSSDRFEVVIESVDAHAGESHQTTDTIVVASQVINNLQSIVSRNVNPFSTAVLTIGKIKGSARYNAVAKRVTMEGTTRTFLSETKKMVKRRFFSIVNSVAASMEATAHIQYWDGYSATINTPEWAERVRATSQALLGADATPEIGPSLGAEDFGRFLLEYPGAYFRLGTAVPQAEEQKRLHDSRFGIDEAALPIGTELMAQITVDALYQLKGQRED